MRSSWSRQKSLWRSGDRRVATAPAPVVPDAANLRGYLEGDNVDGANNTLLANGDPVGGLVPAVNLGTLGGTFAQALGGNQPTFQAAAGPGGTKAAVVFDGTDWLTSGLPSTSWSFLHDGTGATVYSVVRTNASAIGTIAATGTGSSTVIGMGHRYVASFNPSYFMSDGVTLKINTTGGAGAVTSGAFDLMTTALAAADTPDLSIYVNGVMVGAGATAAAFTAAPSLNSLTFGATPVGGSGLVGPIRRILIYQGSHTPAQIAAVLAYCQTLDAVTYPAA